MNTTEKLFSEAKELHKNGRLEEAILNYKKILKKINNNPHINYLIGTAYLQLKNYKETVKYIETAIEFRKDNASYYNNLGIALSQLNNNIDAIENYKKALKLDPNHLDANINLGIAYKKTIKFDEAMKYFAKSLKLSPDNYKIYNNIGNLFRNMGRPDDAIKAYDKSIEKKKDNVEAYNNKAEIFLSKKNFSEGIKMFRKAIDIDSNFSYMFGKYIHTKMHICNWNNYYNDLKKLEIEIKNNKKVIEPFPLLSLIDDMDIQKKNAILYSNTAFQNFKDFELKKKNKHKQN